MKNGKAAAGKRCTMCYRCISRCPEQAITLLGKEVKEQCGYENIVRVIPVCRRFGQAQGGRTIKHTITARLREKPEPKAGYADAP